MNRHQRAFAALLTLIVLLTLGGLWVNRMPNAASPAPAPLAAEASGLITPFDLPTFTIDEVWWINAPTIYLPTDADDLMHELAAQSSRRTRDSGQGPSLGESLDTELTLPVSIPQHDDAFDAWMTEPFDDDGIVRVYVVDRDYPDYVPSIAPVIPGGYHVPEGHSTLYYMTPVILLSLMFGFAEWCHQRSKGGDK